MELTRSNRALLAELEPDFWRKSANADELHQAFITLQVANGTSANRVLERDGRVIGYAVRVEAHRYRAINPVRPRAVV